MKADHLYQALKEIAEKFGIEVAEQNFRITGIPVKSGYCKVKGRELYLIDKHKTLHRKIDLLSAFLVSRMAAEDVYLVPAVRDHLAKYRSPGTDGEKPGDAPARPKSPPDL
jgi:hypothetical protein